MDTTVPQTRRINLASVLRSWRAFSLPVSVLPVIAATAAALPLRQWRWDILVAAVLAAGLLHIAGNLLNDYFDFRKGVDRRLEGDDARPGRVLVRRQMLPRDVLVESAIALLLAAALTAYIIWSAGPVLLWFALAAAAAIYAYTGPPFELKYHALGELVIFIVFGPLLVLAAAYAQVQQFPPAALWLSIPIGLATTGILVSGNFRDRQEDSQAGIKTIAQFAGGAFIRGVYVAVILGSAIGMGLIGALCGPRLLLAAPLTLLLAVGPLAAILRAQRLPDIDARTAKYVTALIVLAIVAYVVGW